MKTTHRLRLSSEGRGTGYTRRRGLVESALRIAYRGDWPAKLWAAFPPACRVTCVRRTVAILPPAHPPVRVGFVSDIHIGPTTPHKLLDAAFGQLAEEALDVLLLGGDYIFLDATEEKAALLGSLVRRVPAARKFAVLGNHDLWTHHVLIERELRAAGVQILTNQHAILKSAAGSLALLGLDDPWTGTLDAPGAIRGIGEPDAVVVLCHSPDGLPHAVHAVRGLPGSPAGLYVCGHTHGGQIATPWGPLVVPGMVGKKYPHGFHWVSPLHVHVSRGVGGVEVPMRTYAAPEVAVFELVPKCTERIGVGT